MRDPERVVRILSLLKAYWMLYPDLRLGQIVSNFNTKFRKDEGLPLTEDVFNLEDADFERVLRNELRGNKRQ